MMKRFLAILLFFMLCAIHYPAYAGSGTATTSCLTVSDIITRVRCDLNEAAGVSNPFWTDTNLIQWTDEAVRKIVFSTGCLHRTKYSVTLVENQWIYPISWTGYHTAAGNWEYLVDTNQSWTADALIGKIVWNITDGSKATIEDNASTTVTGTLAGGTDNDWDTSDLYVINPFVNVSLVIHDSGTAGDKTRIFSLDMATGPIGHEREQGRPKVYGVWDNNLLIWPIPGSNEAATSLYLFEVELPEAITASTDTIVTPIFFDDAIVNYVKAKACLKDDRETTGVFYMSLFDRAINEYMVNILGRQMAGGTGL